MPGSIDTRRSNGQPASRPAVHLKPSVARARIVVVSEEPLDGRGLALLLRSCAEFDTIWAESMRRAGTLLGSGRPEALLWSGDCLDAAALTTLRETRDRHHDVGLCVLTHRADAEAVELFLAHGAGRFALLLRGCRPEVGELVTTLDGVFFGRSLVEPRVLEEIFALPGDDEGQLGSLTPNEREILGLVAAGLRNRAIGRRLWKSEKAVEKHVGHIFCKLGLQPTTNGDLDRRVAAARIFMMESEATRAPRRPPRLE